MIKFRTLVTDASHLGFSARDALRGAVALVGDVHEGFEKVEHEVAEKGGVRDPAAVAAAIGRKKYGKARFQKMAAAGRKILTGP